MLHLHLILLLTIELLALIAALFLLIYINKQQLSKWYLHAGKAIVASLHIIILATFIHAIAFHFQAANTDGLNHSEFFEKQSEYRGHFDH